MRSSTIINVASFAILALFAVAALAAIPVAIERQARADLDTAITHCEQGYQAACAAINLINKEHINDR